MRILNFTLIVSSILLSSGFAKPSLGDNLNGKWRGYVTEKGKATLVELERRDQQDTIEGKFTILSETQEDIDKGMAFPIVEAERSGNNLKFIVPINKGQVDDDAIVFELLIEGKQLKGHGHELGAGSDNLPITFAKQK